MKRDHHKMTAQHHPNQHHLTVTGTSATTNQNLNTTSSSKSKMWVDEETTAGDMDELLAVLGYKVKSSEMAEVAQKLEQLEMAMGTCQSDGTTTISQLSDTVHYNPSDISGWLESMLSELNPDSIPDPPSPFYNNPVPSTSHPPIYQQQQPRDSLIPNNNIPDLPLPPPDHSLSSSTYPASTSTLFTDDSEYDLRAIPGIIASYTPPTHSNPPSSPESSTTTPTTPRTKRIKHEPISPQPITTTQSQSRPLLVINPQETGVRLVHTLLACAESIQTTNLQIASTLLKQIGLLAVSQSGSMRKVATYFAEALARRIYKIHPDPSLTAVDTYASDVLQSHFYETCPYLKFAHFTANQAILEAFDGAKYVHVVDFSLKQGMQWPALIQALALRNGGAPVFKLTGVGPTQPNDGDSLQEVGWKLAHFAKTLGVEFYFRGLVCDNLEELDSNLLDICPDDAAADEEEVVAVNSVFELHRVMARPNGIEKVLRNARLMKPKIFTVVEQEANHNGPVFLERFNEALHYYSTMFDSLESVGVSNGGGDGEEVMEPCVTSRDVALSEMYLGRQICNVVACEGEERVERHETLLQWRGRLEAAGFETVHLGSNAFKQARMLLALSGGGDGYKVEESGGCLLLGWHTRPLIATSAWRLAGSGS